MSAYNLLIFVLRASIIFGLISRHRMAEGEGKERGEGRGRRGSAVHLVGGTQGANFSVRGDSWVQIWLGWPFVCGGKSVFYGVFVFDWRSAIY